jgi:PIN domain nuclease of toxin-antitoxin system
VPGVALDTHALIWHLVDDVRLSTTARAAIDAATLEGESIYLSAMSLVEITFLAERGRIEPAVAGLLDQALAAPDTALAVVPLDADIARALRRIERAAVPELPDRVIAATALHLDVPLVTRDLAIRAAGVDVVW